MDWTKHEISWVCKFKDIFILHFPTFSDKIMPQSTQLCAESLLADDPAQPAVEPSLISLLSGVGEQQGR